MPKQRLDALLAERGLFDSRSRAAAAVLAGDVRLGSERLPAHKPGQLVAEDVPVAVAEAPPYVSRGGVKLANGLDALGIDPDGLRCVDVGASTGGFTDCLLQRGAVEVACVDVVYGELHWRLRNDPRVTVIERVNARALEPAQLPWPPDLVTVDVSFISLTKVLPAVLAATAERFDCLALVKPQFELGRARVGRGVVHDPGDRREAILGVAVSARDLGLAVRGFAASGLPGPKGNIETFVWCGREGPEVGDLEAAIEAVEA